MTNPIYSSIVDVDGADSSLGFTFAFESKLFLPINSAHSSHINPHSQPILLNFLIV